MIYRTLFTTIGPVTDYGGGGLFIGAVEGDTMPEAAVIAASGLKPYYKLLGITRDADGALKGHGSHVRVVTLPEPVPPAVIGDLLTVADLKD